MFSTSLHTVKLQFILFYKAAKRKCLEGVRIGSGNAKIVSSLVMNKSSSSEKCKWESGMAVLSVDYYLNHFCFILLILSFPFISPSLSSLSPSDETEYEYSGSEEEDEEREMGEPRSGSSQMYKL